MNAKSLLIAVLLLVFLPTSALADCSTDRRSSAGKSTTFGAYSISPSCFTDYGWFPPTPLTYNRLWTHTNYDFDSRQYKDWWNFHHGGVDFVGAKDERGSALGGYVDGVTSVYSIGFGVVAKVDRISQNREYGDSPANLAHVAINHWSVHGASFTVVYGHVIASNELAVGAYVKPGDYLGKMVKASSPVHLHFEVHDKVVQVSEWGGMKNGAVEPMSFLAANPASLTPLSTPDGAGSLIDSDLGGLCSAVGFYNWGCVKDQVIMYPHETPSSVSFQIYNRIVGGSCNYVRITGLSRGYATIRSWDEPYPRAYSGASYSNSYAVLSMPAYIRVPKSSLYSVLTVVSSQPIPAGESRTIEAQCFASDQSNSSNLVPLVTDRIVLVSPASVRSYTAPLAAPDANRTFVGSGSIITYSGVAKLFGRVKDYLKFHGIGFESGTLQVYNTGSCSTVRLSGSGAGGRYNVYTKAWNGNVWTKLHSEVGLPINLNPPLSRYQVYMLNSTRSVAEQVQFQCM